MSKWIKYIVVSGIVILALVLAFHFMNNKKPTMTETTTEVVSDKKNCEGHDKNCAPNCGHDKTCKVEEKKVEKHDVKAHEESAKKVVAPKTKEVKTVKSPVKKEQSATKKK